MSTGLAISLAAPAAAAFARVIAGEAQPLDAKSDGAAQRLGNTHFGAEYRRR
ncbi:MAG: hypothetical protein J0H86_15230 [Xanthomonadaceae bacterium]|nr:hypothetical protein [Xanthomonadaceae bacterium]